MAVIWMLISRNIYKCAPFSNTTVNTCLNTHFYDPMARKGKNRHIVFYVYIYKLHELTKIWFRNQRTMITTFFFLSWNTFW